MAHNISTQNVEKAMIILDGKFLFKVGSIDNYSAQERAELINNNLLEEVNSSQPLRIEVLVENEQTVIYNAANNKHILNVTEADVISGTNIFQQAKVWRDILKRSLIQSRKERTKSYSFNHLLFTF